MARLVAKVDFGTQRTVDIEVEDTHSYQLENGIIVHNTLSKIMDTTEGAHKPLGRYIFNNINFGHDDKLVPKLVEAGYAVRPNPFEAKMGIDKPGWLVTIPTSYDDVDFDEIIVGGQTVYVDGESALDQLERYKFLMDNWVDHNCSVTISFNENEMLDIVEWFKKNWDSYVGVSFIKRQDPRKIAEDPMKAAEDLGYAYLPQEIVSEEKYRAYVEALKPINLDDDSGDLVDEMCGNGGCPIR